MDFWATWCGPCRMEMVELDSLQKKLKDANFEILSLDQQEEADNVRQFIKRKQYDFHVLLDDGAASAKYGVRGIPTLVLATRTASSNGFKSDIRQAATILKRRSKASQKNSYGRHLYALWPAFEPMP